MTFYVKQSEQAQIEGPFTVEHINQLLLRGALDLNATGLADLGQSREEIANARKSDWLNLVHIPGVTGHFPDHIKKRNDLLAKLAIIIIIVVLLALLGLTWVARQIHDL